MGCSHLARCTSTRPLVHFRRGGISSISHQLEIYVFTCLCAALCRGSEGLSDWFQRRLAGGVSPNPKRRYPVFSWLGRLDVTGSTCHGAESGPDDVQLHSALSVVDAACAVATLREAAT